MTHDPNQNRGRGIKKSKFIAKTVIPSDATFDFVSNGENFKITIADFLTALNVTGSIVQVGDALDQPVLDIQGSVNGIRNLRAGTGVTITQHASGSIEISSP